MDAFTADASTRLAAIESVQAVFDSWRPRMEASVDNINTSMGAMRAELTKISRLLERGALEDSTTAPGVLGPHGSTAKRPPAPAHYADGPIGRGLPPLSREHGHGVVYTSNHLPADGMFHSPSCNSVEHLPRQFAPEGQEPPYHQFPHLHFGGRAHGTQFSPYLGNLPKLNFPTFDGLNPKLWQARCEDYFHMYGVDPLVWIQVATMQFSGPAARWLQSVKPRLATTSWEDFGRLLKDRFGKDEHALLLRQLFQLKQSGSVSEYIEHFAQLTDQLNAYQTVSDPLYYTMKFLDGLQGDIKSVVMIQRPRDLDTAFVLAQLQEELADSSKKRDYKKWEAGYSSRPYAKDPCHCHIHLARTPNSHFQFHQMTERALVCHRIQSLLIGCLIFMPTAKPRAYATNVGCSLLGVTSVQIQSSSNLWRNYGKPGTCQLPRVRMKIPMLNYIICCCLKLQGVVRQQPKP